MNRKDDIPFIFEVISEKTCFPFFFKMSAAISTFKASYTLLLIFCSSLD